MISRNTWYKGDNPDIDKIEWKNGTQSLTYKGYPSIIIIKRVLEPSPLNYDKVQGEVMTGYQEFLDSEWIRQLNKKYNVKIDNVVFQEVKKNINNE